VSVQLAALKQAMRSMAEERDAEMAAAVEPLQQKLEQQEARLAEAVATAQVSDSLLCMAATCDGRTSYGIRENGIRHGFEF